jgi:uncharacterized protein YqjF (DUF2071 family)
MTRPFLTAAWRNLAMLNWAVKPALIEPFVPRGTSIDLFQGRTFISLVGFMFLDTRVRGWAIPFHRTFEEVNLRFYVKRGERRGVVFLKELVPRAAIAWVARTVYGENYESCPMSHAISAADPPAVRYAWRHRGREFAIELDPSGPWAPLEGESAFIAEHYWGYARRGDSTVEYEVTHPRWRATPAARAVFTGDARELYGERFADILSRPPASAFLAEGSEVEVMKGSAIS